MTRCVRWMGPMLMAALIVLGMGALAAGGEQGKQDGRTRQCLRCHPDVERQFAGQGRHDPFAKARCLDCHAQHATKYKGMLRKEAGELCRDCHASLSSGGHDHAPFREGDCLKCHNPHAAPGKNLLRAKGEDLCFGCHAREGAFAASHRHEPAARGACLSCHGPHGSGVKGMLRREPAALCASCHDKETVRMRSAHGGRSVLGTDCASCHNPHGSSDKGLVRQQMHKPFASGTCNACHTGRNGQKALKENTAALCLGCHEQQRGMFGEEQAHVGSGAFCTDCHAPHVSDQEHLVREKEKTLCLGCHADTAMALHDARRPHLHPLVEQGKCSACHEPHGSGRPAMLRGEEKALCTACHESHKNYSHPTGEGVVDPRSKTVVTCVTCHDLMGSPNTFTLRFNRDKELCIQCHKGY